MFESCRRQARPRKIVSSDYGHRVAGRNPQGDDEPKWLLPATTAFLPAITTDKPKEPYDCSAQVLKALEPGPTGEMKSQLVLQ
eukprot:3189715-Heterocapsa_arctica.AAC.1